MRVSDLPLADELAAHYEAAGIEELYPPQAAAVEAGVARGENVVVAVPTASGKTFVAELAMLTADGPALYIVPLRALAREKYESFSGLPGVDVGISTGDADSAEGLGSYDVVVATAEKVDSAIRSGAPWVDDLACVVVDEVHLLGSEGRGPTLEVTMATLERRAPAVQVVALSATVANPDEIADWLDAELVRSRWRPVDLRTGVYAGGSVAFDDGSTLPVPVDDDADDPGTAATLGLARGAVEDGGQCLAFVRSRREAEALAARLAEAGLGPDGGPGDRAGTDGEGASLAAEVRAAGRADTGRRLADCVAGGVAFHHAGLRAEHRRLVENAFRDRRLRCICATPTLAAGVNVPARRVVIRDQQRYTGSGMTWLPVLEVHQMCGRAGRPGLDPYGEAVLVAGDDADREDLVERYVGADPEAVESQLADREALRTHVLAIVASGFAESRAGVLDVLDATFYAHGRPEESLAGLVDQVVADLVDWEMLTDGTTLAATTLGAAVSRQYVAPRTGARVVAGVRTMADMETVTGLTALEVVCDTPDMHGTYLGNRERAAMYQFVRRHADELTTEMGETEAFERWLEAVKTARILHEWAEGATTDELVEAYRIGPGDLESRVERAEWLLGAAAAVADVVGGDGEPFRSVRERL